ncbi:MAG: TlpA family protein disulfide reductase [Nitrospinae bacterium]|nr:TlpA family protein disulfide reductase [Nitrospinota bacterium]
MQNINLKISKIILCVLCGEILLSGCKEGNKPTTANIGNHAPKFALTDLNKKTVNLAHYKGKKVILNFWATWCPPCVNEMPLLQEVYNNRRGEGIEIIGINYNEDYDRVKKFISEKGVTFTILIDSDLKVSMDYGVIGLPVTFFIDREGRIKEKFKGELNKKLIEDILNRF